MAFYRDPKSGRRSDRGGRFKAARLEDRRAKKIMDAQLKEAVLSAIQAHRDEIRAVGVRRLGLFGSFARNEQTAESDVDLLVEFDPGQKTFDNFMKLTLLIEDLCERRVDLVTREALSPYLRRHVMTEVEYANLDN